MLCTDYIFVGWDVRRNVCTVYVGCIFYKSGLSDQILVFVGRFPYTWVKLKLIVFFPKKLEPKDLKILQKATSLKEIIKEARAKKKNPKCGLERSTSEKKTPKEA